MAQNYNKILLLLPPYHCELNPIELIWTQIKNKVASKNTTFKLNDAKNFLCESIKNVIATDLKNCIHHVIKEENKMWGLDGLTDTLMIPLIVSVGNYEDSNSSDSSLTSSDRYWKIILFCTYLI